MTHVVSVDLGGTNARFAIAEVSEGKVQALGAAFSVKAADYAGLADAWHAFAAHAGPLPRAAAIGIAADPRDAHIKLTNNGWTIDRATLGAEIGVDQPLLLNDFAAMAHAVQHLDAGAFTHIAGPDAPLSTRGVITVAGPGTGLGVAQLWRGSGSYQVIETEGGHGDFAPLDAFEDALLATLRREHRRVSTERVAAGPGIAAIYHALAAERGEPLAKLDHAAIWARAQSGEDPFAVAARDRFMRILGAVVGDLALVHGAHAVVLAGGVAQRLRDHLAGSGFAARFVAKGRFAERMEALPVKLVTHPEPGLLGAAAAFAQEL